MPLKLSMKILSPAKPGGKMSRIFKAAFKDAQPKIAALIVDRVTTEANRVFKTMAPLYTEGLNKPDTVKLTDGGITVALGTKVSQAMETGASAWDIKKAMLAKAKKFSKQGSPYIDVPFKHTTTGSRGSTRLPAAVKAAIDAHAPSPGSSGARATTTRLPMKQKARRRFTRLLRDDIHGKVSQKVKHKSGLQSGLIRRSTRGTKKAPGATSYSTVRRISMKSNTSSWWHPGFKEAGILKKTLPKLKSEIRAILVASLAKVTGGKR
jgi:hypothetical protein